MSTEAIALRRRGRGRPPRKAKAARLRRRMVLYAVALVLLVPFVFPTWWMVTSSLKPIDEIFAFPPSLLPTDPVWHTYADVFRMQPFAREYLNSMYIAVVVTVGTLIVSSLAGYSFARVRFRGQGVLFVLLLSGLLMPSEVTIVPLFRMMRAAGLIDTHWPLILVPVLGAQGVFATFIMRQFFLGLPDELEDAGRLDGLGRFGLFRHVALPLARPALAAVAIITFLYSWNLFLEPLVFLSSKTKFTLPLALTQYQDAYGSPVWNVQLAATTLTVFPVLLVFVLAQRQFIEGISRSGLKG